MMLKQLLDDSLYDSHSEFQMDWFITGSANGGSLYGMYKQAIKELAGRLGNLRIFYFERKRVLLKIEELEHEIRDRTNDDGTKGFDVRGMEIDLEEARVGLVFLDRNHAENYREADRFYRQAVVLKARVGELTVERRYDLERELFQWILMRRCAQENMAWNRGPGPGTMDLFHQLPPQDQAALGPLIHDNEKIAVWVQEKQEAQGLTMAQIAEEAAAVQPLSLSPELLLCYSEGGVDHDDAKRLLPEGDDHV
jgi:hypothetical protein